MIVNLFIISFACYFNMGFLTLLAIFFIYFGFSISLGPVIWIYAVEILEEELVYLTSLNKWLFTFIIGYFVPFLIADLGLFKTFLSISLLNVIIFAFLYIFLVETKGKTLKQIDSEFTNIYTNLP